MYYQSTLTIGSIRGAKVVITYEFEGGPDTDYPNTVVLEEELDTC